MKILRFHPFRGYRAKKSQQFEIPDWEILIKGFDGLKMVCKLHTSLCVYTGLFLFMSRVFCWELRRQLFVLQ